MELSQFIVFVMTKGRFPSFFLFLFFSFFFSFFCCRGVDDVHTRPWHTWPLFSIVPEGLDAETITLGLKKVAGRSVGGGGVGGCRGWKALSG